MKEAYRIVFHCGRWRRRPRTRGSEHVKGPECVTSGEQKTCPHITDHALLLCVPYEKPISTIQNYYNNKNQCRTRPGYLIGRNFTVAFSSVTGLNSLPLLFSRLSQGVTWEIIKETSHECRKKVVLLPVEVLRVLEIKVKVKKSCVLQLQKRLLLSPLYYLGYNGFSSLPRWQYLNLYSNRFKYGQRENKYFLIQMYWTQYDHWALLHV